MEIVRKQNYSVSFREIAIGDAFCSNGFYFIRCENIDGLNREVNAICLETGHATFFGPDNEVDAIHRRIILE